MTMYSAVDEGYVVEIFHSRKKLIERFKNTGHYFDSDRYDSLQHALRVSDKVVLWHPDKRGGFSFIIQRHDK